LVKNQLYRVIFLLLGVFIMTIMTKLALSVKEFISDLNFEISYPLSHMEAPTGRGKSTFILDKLSHIKKILLLCPVTAQVTQLSSDYLGDPRVQCFTNDSQFNNLTGDVVIAVYDKLPTLLELYPELKDYVLVIDEAHKIYQAAGYRQAALSTILNAITNNTFKQVVTVSATFQSDIFPIVFDEQILISHQPLVKPAIDVTFYKTKKKMDDALAQIRPSAGKVAIVRINNKKQIKLVKIIFELMGLKVLEVYSENQKSPEVVRFLETSEVTGYDIVLTTSLLDEAINIKNGNIESVYIFHRLHIDEVKQFIGRCRNSTPHVYLNLMNSELERKEINLLEERSKIESISQLALSLALELGEKTGNYTREVRNVNTTTHASLGFKPLHYDYMSQEPPCINEIAILAKLYDISMRAQYVNDSTLNNALLLSDCFSKVLFFDANTIEPSEATIAIISQAREIQEQERHKAVEQCLLELDCANEGISELTIDDVTNLARTHEKTGTMGEISNNWKNLCLILPVEQALDAVQKNRQEKVWEFNEAVSQRLDYKPFFDKIKADIVLGGRVVLIGKNAINKYFTDALREIAKKQKGFKKYISKLNISGLEVQQNNKFKISNRYLYAFIRNFTNCEESRKGNVQRFIIKEVGLFGYDYKIRQLMTSSPRKPLRKTFAARVEEFDELPF